MRTLQLLLLLCMLGSIASCDVFRPEYDPHNKIVFYGTIYGVQANALFVMNPDGTEVRRLSKESFAWPTWSPDAQTIIGAYRYGETTFIQLIDYTGKNRRELLLSTNEYDPSMIRPVSWSPDGKKIVYTGCHRCGPFGGAIKTQVTDLETGDTYELIPESGGDIVFPKWSPKEDKIVVQSNNLNTRSNFFLMNPDGTEEEQITNTEDGLLLGSIWSRDGKYLYYLHISDDYLVMEVREMNVVTKVSEVLNTIESTSISDTWDELLSVSPDGKYLLLLHEDHNLYTIDLTTKEVKKIVIQWDGRPKEGYVQYADWSN